jgi:iron complex outermembrane receptor protein
VFGSSRLSVSIRAILGVTATAFSAMALAQDPRQQVEEIRVIGVTPGSFSRQALNRIPYAVHTTLAAELAQSQSLDVSDYLNTRAASVSINSAQNNPLQADLRFRGFTASPLLGLPQGLSVYQNGVRVNEPLGDSVNWDMLPESAVSSIDLVGGSNPVYGLNTLGGALALTMKNGFNFSGTEIETLAGSWDRSATTFETGGNNGTWGMYINLSHFDEEGWRQLSESEATNFYGSLSWRDGDTSAVDFNVQRGVSDLIGNGAIPVGLLEQQRDAIFTAPDVTENDVSMLSLEGSHAFSGNLRFSGNAYWRENDTDSFNGDASEFEVCEFAGGARALFEEDDELEDALEDDLEIELDEICEGEEDDIRSFGDLEEFIEEQAELAGLDDDAYEPEDMTDELSGTGTLSDEAINNISNRKQESRGFGGQLEWGGDLFARPSQLVTGVNYFEGESTFDSVLELSDIDPVTRSTQGLGVGTFVDEAATSIETSIETASLYFLETLDVTGALALTLSGRYNRTDIRLRDQSGERPELNGDHEFSRFNPALGFTWNPDTSTTYYGSWSQSSRMPTPIELACNEGVFELARQYAIADGEDPDDIEFECRLPNAFLADPPLKEVVTSTFELGTRGTFANVRYQFGIFQATNEDDIIFQTTGRATGLFANVEETQRRGFESSFGGTLQQLDWYLSYAFTEATFEDDFAVLSPNHPEANDEGEIDVESGDRMPGQPANVFKIGGDYHFTPAFSVGGEAVYNSSQVLRGDESNQMDTLDGYTLVNLRAAYTLAERLTVFARVSNVFDEDYVNFGLVGEDPSEVIDTLSNNAPVFVGAGAPRAGWIGVRYRF